MSKKIKMDKDDFKKEHKRLLKVLKSPSHKDDLQEAKKQELEIQKYKRRGEL